MTTENKFYEFENKNNGGRERVYRTDGKYFISSDWGDGFFGKTEVTRSQMEAVLSHTNAPEYVVNGILGK